MGRNIIICVDGTGNTFDKRMTNVTGMIKCLRLDKPGDQLVIYDQGVGAGAYRVHNVEAYRDSLGDHEALTIMPSPTESRFAPKTLLDRARGLLFGYGLKENVRQLYIELSKLYRSPGDRVFLFGFSRGAFTVRALAGLLYRCHLPSVECVDLDERFERAWELYIPLRPDEEAVRRFGADQRPCRVHFLGVWDTVKSYGGLIPIALPHLRHNPIVRHIRHALALDERRAWFKVTTWGQLDSDEAGAMTRAKTDDLPLYHEQAIDEVWFAGCHSDIGGGGKGEATARIALRWMLSEAVNVDGGVLINKEGIALLSDIDPVGPPEIHSSQNAAWWLAEQIPRMDIDNSGEYPIKKLAWGSDGARNPDKLRRKGSVYVHATAVGAHSIQPRIEVRHTKPLPASYQH